MSVSHAQCLLFAVHEIIDNRPRELRDAPTPRRRNNVTPTPKAYALFSEVFSEERPEVLPLLEQNNICILKNENASSLSLLGQYQLEIIELLFEERPSTSLDPLSTTSYHSDREFITQLCPNLTVSFRKDQDITRVLPAVDDKNFKAVKRLLSHKAVTLCSYQKELLVYFAARRGPECLLRLAHRAKVKIQWNGYVTSLLMADATHARVARNDKMTVLHIAARNGHAPTVRLLITHGIPVNREDIHRQTALHVAAKEGHPDVVKILLHSGALVDQIDSDGHTALHIASNENHPDIVEILLRNGALVDRHDGRGSTALFNASCQGLPDIVRILLRNGASVDRKNFKSTALHISAVLDNLDIAEILLHNGANINSRTSDQKTPILAAVSCGHRELVDILLKYGAQVMDEVWSEHSVLHEAWFKRSPEMFEYLLEKHFLNLELLKETLIIKVILAETDEIDEMDYMNGPFYNLIIDVRTAHRKCKDILARHIVKIELLDLYHVFDEVDAAPLWTDSIGMTLSAFKLQCGEEVSHLKSETVGDIDLSFYDILAADSYKVARCLRNSSVAAIAVSDQLQEKFPVYGSILSHHFQKAEKEKQLLEESSKVFYFLLPRFKKLPDEIKEKIIAYLSFKDLRILLKTCGHLVVSH